MHYVYRTTFEDGQFYIGVRKLPPDTTASQDSYLGSGKALKRKLKTHTAEKQVVAVFESQKQAYELERQLVTYETLQDPLCLNLVLGGRGGYLETVALKKRWQRDKCKLSAAIEKTAAKRRGKTKHTDAGLSRMAQKLTGRSKHTHEHVALTASALRGRSKDTHDYLRRAGEKVAAKLKNRPRPEVAQRMSLDGNPSRIKSIQAAKVLEQLDAVPAQLTMLRHSPEAQLEALLLAKRALPRKQIALNTGIPESTVNAFLAKLVQWTLLNLRPAQDVQL